MVQASRRRRFRASTSVVRRIAPVCACHLLCRSRHLGCRAPHVELRRQGGEQHARKQHERQRVAGRQGLRGRGLRHCHTMATAAATGTVGPNLDELRPNQERSSSRYEGRQRDALVRRQAEPDADQGCRGLRRHRRRNRAGRQDLVRPRRQEGRGLRSDQACFEQAFGNLAYDEGPKAALDKLRQLSDTNPSSGAIAIPCPTRSERAGS